MRVSRKCKYVTYMIDKFKKLCVKVDRYRWRKAYQRSSEQIKNKKFGDLDMGDKFYVVRILITSATVQINVDRKVFDQFLVDGDAICIDSYVGRYRPLNHRLAPNNEDLIEIDTYLAEKAYIASNKKAAIKAVWLLEKHARHEISRLADSLIIQLHKEKHKAMNIIIGNEMA